MINYIIRVRRNLDFSSEIEYPELENNGVKKFVYKSGKSATKQQAASILRRFDYTPKTVEKVKSYIRSCKGQFENGEFPEKDLKFLTECVEFVQGSLEELVIFTKIAVGFKQYNKAKSVIFSNLNNEGITREEKEKLRKLTESIDLAMRKTAAVNMIQSPTPNIEDICQQTKLSTTEVISILRKVYVDVVETNQSNKLDREKEGH